MKKLIFILALATAAYAAPKYDEKIFSGLEFRNIGILKPEQMELIWAYIGSVNGWKAAARAQQ